MQAGAAATAAERAELGRILRARIDSCQLELPPLPHVAQQALAMAADERSNAAALSRLIHQDQALAGHVLRIANSAAFAGRMPIVSLQHAIAHLGLAFLSGVVVAVSVRGSLFRLPGLDEQVRYLWRHSLLSAFFAREVARRRRQNAETAFLCGLLHSIGRPVVLKAAVEIARGQGVSLDVGHVLALVEEHHGQAGALLAVRWSLPRPVLESIIYCAAGHGQPTFGHEALTAAVAARLAQATLAGDDEAAARVAELEPVRALNLYRDDLAALLELRPELKALVDSMSP
jgi:HD-like signal output (HDOD) protein